jgi:beta-fructofuranosidase
MDPSSKYRGVIKSRDKAVYAQASVELRRWLISQDPHYPLYHFTGPESWINDPNGPIYYEGNYHPFYQFLPPSSERKGLELDKFAWGYGHEMSMGHAVSRDLVHWEDWPIALWPDTEYDRNGVYSGNSFVDDQGQLCLAYTGNVDGHKCTFGMLARSHDAGKTFAKKMVLDNCQRPNEKSPVHWDGQVWRDEGAWFQLIGGTDGTHGVAWLWSSRDLENWELQGNIAPSIQFGKYWELPYLIPLGNRYLLMVGCGNPYWVGEYDKEKFVFTPDDGRAKSIDNGAYYSFNPNMVDDKGPGGSNRRIMHGWVTGPACPTDSLPCWQGAHSIPRVLTLDGDRVRQEPIEEIQVLRGKHFTIADLGGNALLRSITGNSLELKATFAPGDARKFGIKLRVSEEGDRFILVYFDSESRTFGIDGHTIDNRPQDSYLKPDEDVTLHIFLDRSIVEVYVNGSAQTAKTFPDRTALGLDLFSEKGDAALRSLDVWEMKSMWE